MNLDPAYYLLFRILLLSRNILFANSEIAMLRGNIILILLVHTIVTLTERSDDAFVSKYRMRFII